MNSIDDEIAIYWDLDHLPTTDAALVHSALALAGLLGPLTVQRALGSPATHNSRLAQALERRGTELLLTLPSCGMTPRPPLQALHECLVQDLSLHPRVGRVVVVSAQRDLAPLKRFVQRAGRQWLRLRGAQREPGSLPCGHAPLFAAR
ncbi:hypothetical protein KAK07_02740 [Ideonella sp. 4Y16]|uniref:hypothetical protein n=1 Tax=Ideonella alba TaxID=2824118 RepID=UPI001B358D48|nr:hypothetical protein [Ideonella alba]MBQ0942247.1 hypothetical protein [Ideonella alba]